MTVINNPDSILYAVVEHLKSSRHIHDLVDHPPQTDSQYRIVCLTARAEDAWEIVHLLCAVGSGPYTYTVCPADSVGGDGPVSSPPGGDGREEGDAGATTTALS